ncbi:hypothetical protein HK102_011301 [Quaeritorhiza haematococci]|nr:hypothetical protein HK102_011301 [Quaeritorhiza haematococci]
MKAKSAKRGGGGGAPRKGHGKRPGGKSNGAGRSASFAKKGAKGNAGKSFQKPKHKAEETTPYSHQEEMEEYEDASDGGSEDFEDMVEDVSAEEEGGADGWEMEEDDADEVAEEAEEDEEEGDGEEEGEETPNKKAKTEAEAAEARLSRAEQKALLKERRAQKPHAAMIDKAKKIWEELRLKKLKSDRRAELMAKMLELIKSQVCDIIFKHDASRIIQTCLKYGNASQRDIIATELKGRYVELAKNHYGRFIVSKLLNLCPNHRNDVIKSFYGKVRKLIRHSDAAMVVEEAYSQYANAEQRSALLEEFYGPEFALFKASGIRTLDSLLKEQPAKKQSILKHMRETINSLLEKGAANIGPLSIVHRALLEYILHAFPFLSTPSTNKNKDSSASTPSISLDQVPSDLRDLMEQLKDHLVTILHTREGARIAQICILLASPKDRKAIIKTFKGVVRSIAKEQYGHTVLLSVFECVDDTVLVGKSIINELFGVSAGSSAAGSVDAADVDNDLADLLRDRYASRVLLYLLCGRNRKYQPPFVVQELESMNAMRALTSKKDDELKKPELLAHVSKPLIKACAARCKELLRDRSGSQLLLETWKSATGEKDKLAEELSALVSGTIESYKSDTEEHIKSLGAVAKLSVEARTKKLLEEGVDLSEHALVNRSATFALKDLVANIRKAYTATSEEGASQAQDSTLAAKLLENLDDHLAYWLRYCAGNPRSSSGTAFVLVAMLECDNVVLPDGEQTLQKGILEVLANKKGLLKELQSTVKTNLEKTAKESEPGAASAKKQNGKRKRGGKVDSESRETERVTGIETFLKVWQGLSQ